MTTTGTSTIQNKPPQGHGVRMFINVTTHLGLPVWNIIKGKGPVR
jgi:hypothetical protein